MPLPGATARLPGAAPAVPLNVLGFDIGTVGTRTDLPRTCGPRQACGAACDVRRAVTPRGRSPVRQALPPSSHNRSLRAAERCPQPGAKAWSARRAPGRCPTARGLAAPRAVLRLRNSGFHSGGQVRALITRHANRRQREPSARAPGEPARQPSRGGQGGPSGGNASRPVVTTRVRALLREGGPAGPVAEHGDPGRCPWTGPPLRPLGVTDTRGPEQGGGSGSGKPAPALGCVQECQVRGTEAHRGRPLGCTLAGGPKKGTHN